MCACVFWFILFVFVLGCPNIKLHCHDLQMKEAVAEGLMGFKEGEISLRIFYYYCYYYYFIKDTGKDCMYVMVLLLEVAIPLGLVSFLTLSL